ncbi:MAG: cytidine deaminase, partial [Thermoprotei archaeon]
MSSQIIEKLIEDASRVLANSYSPYSGIRVAAAV